MTYSHFQFGVLSVDIAGLRMKVCILLMASRAYVLCLFLQLNSNILDRIDKYYLYKITVYENSNEE
jgi:hypothetical protein